MVKAKSSHAHILLDTLIIGAGFSGIGMAIKLKKAGVENFAILERHHELGGTWRDNHYPGAACDIPSQLYSYSFAPNPQWSKSYSGSEEILAYIKNVAHEYDIEKYIHFNSNVKKIVFQEESNTWLATTEQGKKYTAKTVLMAQGPLSNPKMPAIKGLEDFKGKIMHSANWDNHYDLSNKRVAVIGSGASAIQIVPNIVTQVKSLKVFQRTAPWILPKVEYTTPKWQTTLFQHTPIIQNTMRGLWFYIHETMATGIVWNTRFTRVLEKLSSAYMHSQVKDRWLRRQLTPDYSLGCKRLLMSNDYYSALQETNCELITWPIAEIRPDGILTSEGIIHETDCLIMATGFDVPNNNTPFDIIGLNGKNLNDDWCQGAYAYKSINVAGYPNLFMTFGPNSGPGHNSALVYIEAQLDYSVKVIKHMLENHLSRCTVKADVQDEHNAALQKRLSKTTWNSGCSSWYLTPKGFNAAMYPGFASQYQMQMAEFKKDDYIFR